MRLIDADRLCEGLLNRWSIADTRKEELIRQVMADIVTPIVVSQPTINEPQKWIPVSERLPKRDEVVLVTYKTTGKIHLCKYLDDTSENAWWSYIDDCYAWNNVVLAWMPLPPAYKGEEK